MEEHKELQFLWPLLGLQPQKATVFGFYIWWIRRKWWGRRKGPRQQAFLSMARSHNLTSLFLPTPSICLFQLVGGRYKQNCRKDKSGNFCLFFFCCCCCCFGLVLIFCLFLCFLCVFCFFFEWFIRQAPLSGPCYSRWPQPLIPVSWVHRQLPLSWKWPHLCQPGACELPLSPCRYSSVKILWLRHLSENQWTNVHQNNVHLLHTRKQRTSNATR